MLACERDQSQFSVVQSRTSIVLLKYFTLFQGDKSISTRNVTFRTMIKTCAEVVEVIKNSNLRPVKLRRAVVLHMVDTNIIGFIILLRYFIILLQ